MTNDFFVMIYHPNSRVNAMPLVIDDDGQVAFYMTAEDAHEAARDNDLAKAYGYEVFELGNHGGGDS